MKCRKEHPKICNKFKNFGLENLKRMDVRMNVKITTHKHAMIDEDKNLPKNV